MRQSHYFLKTSKTSPQDDESINAKFLEQAGFVQKTMAGVYTYLPLGLRVLAKIENIIRDTMSRIGAQEVLMPALQSKENWVKTGRWDSLDVLFKLESEHGNEYALGPTHEEVVTPMAQPIIQSYKDFPLAVYQIQTKFRDELRAKSGLLRGREFRMKDLYSFHANEADLENYYTNVVAPAYHSIFNQMKLLGRFTEASGGSFTKYSHEYQVEIPSGEDTIFVCDKCGMAKNKEIFSEGVECTNCGKVDWREAKASEVGNIFQLKTKFSEALNLNFTAEDGSKQLVQMGCYGIGPSRLMGVIVEKYNDEKGIVWPEAVAPFKVHLIAIAGKDGEDVVKQADDLYQSLQSAGIEVLYDDRDKGAGEKFADSDLIGIPYRLVISSKTLTEGNAEIKKRNSTESELLPLDTVVNYFSNT